MTDLAYSLLTTLGSGVGLSSGSVEVELTGGASLPSPFALTDLAQASIGVAGWALGSLIGLATGTTPPRVAVDRRLASAWFASSIRPPGLAGPSPLDALFGDYATSDGWIRIHTNAPHHRARAVAVLGAGEERRDIATAARTWRAEDLETEIIAAGGAAAAMRTAAEWRRHPQGHAVGQEPLVWMEPGPAVRDGVQLVGDRARPLSGMKVLDLTRVIAGPVATRLLAGWGADVLRIDPPDWDEPSVVPETTLGKHCTRLDLRSDGDRNRFVELLSGADVVISGYRSDALQGLGYGIEERGRIRPGLVDVSLDAYGWTGPWATRRGFDTLVQMSSGIADIGRRQLGSDKPGSLPVAALDHATGYLMAAAAIAGISRQLAESSGSRWRTSLASIADVLIRVGVIEQPDPGVADNALPDHEGPVEVTVWGDLRRLPPPLTVAGAPLNWDLPARPLGSDPPEWR
jgi:hypothetical protein